MKINGEFVNMLNKSPFYVQVLEKEFEKRKSQNANYSLRMFAKDLGIHSASLSSIMRGHRSFPWRLVVPVCRTLAMTEDNSQKFIASIRDRVTVEDLKVTRPRKKLDVERYATIIEDWEYFAILNYFEIIGSPKNVDSIAQKFNLPVSRVEFVIERLLEVGFLEKQNGKIVRSVDPIRTSDDIPSSVLRKAHHQELDLVKERMENLEPLFREISSITFSGSAAKMTKAKKLIRSFRDKMSEIMDGEDAQDVYLLAIQLVPLTQPSLMETEK
jgi:uncharacterized protein (TIGR02147 family)